MKTRCPDRSGVNPATVSCSRSHNTVTYTKSGMIASSPLQSQKAVTAHLKSEQLLYFGFGRYEHRTCPGIVFVAIRMISEFS